MDNLYRLSFVSRSTLSHPDADRSTSVADIVSISRRRNQAADLTGILGSHDDTFLEVIEGPRSAVEATFDRIQHDTRHRDVRLLQRAPAEQRLFPGEPMAFLDHDPRVAALLADALERPAAGSRSADEDAVATAMAALLAEDAAVSGGHAREAEAPAVVPVELVVLDDMYATALLAPDGRIVRANTRYLDLFGHDSGALIGRRREPSCHDGSGRAGQEKLWAALRRGESCRSRYLALRADGTEFWVEGTFTPQLDSSGTLREVVEVAADVSQQQRAQAEQQGQIEAITAFQSVVHFAADGTILDANPLFLRTMGYALDEVAGRHHRMFVEATEAGGDAYRSFWTRLAAGQHQAGEYRRLAKGGRDVWLQATYSPIFDPAGRLIKIVKYATDVTAQKLRQADFQWQVAAIHKSHAVITFTMDGLICEANDIFLEVAGYTLDEVQGQHHRMFVDPAYAHSAHYAAFWRDLGRGHHQAGQYRRRRRDGSEMWLQASYNPVFDMAGRPVKVVKYATEVTDEKRQQAEHQGQIAAIHKTQCVISFDLDGTIVDANANFLAATGYRLAEIRGRHHRMFVEAADTDSPDYQEFWQALAAGHHRSGEFKRQARDGREIWLQATYHPIFDLAGRPFRVVKYATDITVEKLRQADYQGQIEAIRKSQGVVSFGLDGTILEANDEFLRTVGYAREELEGRHHRVLLREDDAVSSGYQAFWANLRSGNHQSGLYKRVHRDGDDVWIQASYNPILDLNGRPFKIVKFATDVTSNVALSEAYEDAKRQAQHDAATSLPNRVRLDAFMSAALDSPSQRLVLFYLDLDRFKPINDTYGHEAGDRVLGEVADRLRRQLSYDQLAARVGGDEFVVAAPEMPDDEIEAFAQRLIDVVRAPIRSEGCNLSIGVSVGIAVAPADGTSPDQLLRCADAALYRSKESGRSTFSFFAATSNERLTVYRNMVNDICRALEQEQFFLEYQPRFDTRGREMRSVEALIRWNHPERGRISPMEFIPIAERCGLITEIGEWVLATACRDAAAWPSIGVSVNVSPVQFQLTDIVAVATRILHGTGMDPGRLELEITEGVLLQDADRARKALDGLKALGISLAMDDFGTGYSSLSSLRSFPFDVIKIDRQFITDMDDRDGGRDVVQAILGLGKALGLSVTAEGVETDRQLAMLADDDCNEVQGYLLARPMSRESVRDLLGGQRNLSTSQLAS